MRTIRSSQFQPKITSLLLGGIFILQVLGLSSCAATSKEAQTMDFPADMDSPFLRLEQVVDGRPASESGLWGRIMGLVYGERNQFSLNQPTDMAVDDLGRLLIVDSESGLIYILIKEEGRWLFSDQVTLPEIAYPLSIATSADHVFLSDLSTGMVFILDNNFKLVKSIESDEFRRPGDLCFDELNKRLFVADPQANRVFVFDELGELIAEIGNDGSSRGRLQRPISVTVDPETGRIFILDGIARKVKQYNADFGFVSSFGEYDQVPGSFAFPKGIAISTDGVIFVADVAFGNIQMFDPSGALLYFFGETGTEQGQFLMPRNLFMDRDQHIYVADPYNNRVQIFQYFAQP